ncbi:MAG: rhomboid family intramembrane serine protease [Gemmatimonadota bacterium]
MNESLLGRITPWVGRLLAINAVVLLLQQTLFTSEALTDLLRFDPALAAQRPWTFASYMFVHGGLLHLLGNSLALYVFGPAVEQRLGSSRFIFYYLYCGIGAAIFSLALWYSGFLPVPAFIGASGAVLGVAFAFAKYQPDAELLIFPLPFPIKARKLIWLLVGLDVIGALIGSDNIAHFAHLGGLGAGWLFFALQGIAQPGEPRRLPAMAPRVPVHSRGGGAAQPAAAHPRSEPVVPAPAPAPEPPGVSEAAEIDRVLDKISATGLASLTADERRFLDGVAHRRRDGSSHDRN